MIKFKRTQGNEDPIELAYEGNRTIEDYIVDLADLYDAEQTDIKLVFKGKILNWKTTV
jgi:aspartate 1-decarboxylase